MNRYLFKNKFMIVMYIVLVPIACFFSIRFALAFQPIIDCAIKGNMEGFKESAIWAAVYAGLDCISFFAIKVIRENIMRDTFIGIKEELFSRIITMDIQEFEKENTGSYISIMDNDVELLGNSYFGNLLSVYNVVISFIFSLITVLSLNYIITFILLIIAGLSIVIPKFLKKKLALSQEEYSQGMKIYTSKIKDYFEGFQVIKSFKSHKEIMCKHSEFNENREKRGCKSRKTVFFAGWISMAFSSAMYVVTFVLGGYFTLKGTMSVGLVVALSQLIGGVVAPLERVPAMLSEIYSTESIRKRLEEILKREPVVVSKKNIDGDIEKISLEKVSFRYDNSQREVLKELSLKFEKEKKYAIVGESGSGKSSLAKLISGFYECTDGRIAFENEKSEYKLSHGGFDKLGYVPQSTFLFHDTLRNNICLYRNYSESEIQKAIEYSGLKKVVEKLSEGIDSDIGENGNMFSGGERQRIGLARAFLMGSRFLILDEATSSLDNITSNNILDGVMNMKDITPIIITHQLNQEILEQCDHIYVMREGSIVEEGKFEVLDRENTYFHNLFRRKLNEKYI